MTAEASLNRLEKQQEDVQNEVVEAVALLEDIKSQSSTTEDKLNNTHKAIQQHIQVVVWTLLLYLVTLHYNYFNSHLFYDTIPCNR